LAYENGAGTDRDRTSRAETFIAKVQASYIATNTYHNAIHGAEVVSAVYYFAGHPMEEGIFLRMDMYLLLVAAAVHDMGHPGVNNDFLVKSRDQLALRYNDTSVLESFHAASCFQVMADHDCDLFKGMRGAAGWRQRIIGMVLSTDMAKAKAVMAAFKQQEEDHGDRPEDVAKYDKVAVESAILHASDIGHPLRLWQCHKSWSRRVSAEFLEQGDREKELGFAPMVLFDRDKQGNLASYAKGQIGFIQFVVAPTFRCIKNVVGERFDEPAATLADNLAIWQEIADGKWESLDDVHAPSTKAS
jgi:hypothetical protein